MEAGEVNRLVQLFADTQDINFVAIASLTVLLYDHMVSFEEEVQLMWGARWRALKMFYIWNRYFSALSIGTVTAFRFIEITSDAVCQAAYILESTVCVIVVLSVDCVLMLRVWVLYDRDQRLLFAFVPLLIAEFTTMLLTDHYFVPKQTVFEHLGPTLPGCHSPMFPRSFALFVVPPLVVSSMMFAMTLYKCIPTLRLGMPSRMPIINLFLRDGVFWFLGVLISASAAMISWLVGRPSIVYLVNTPCIVLFSLIASHALLNIKAILIAVTDDDNLDGDYDSSTFHPTILRRLSNASASPRRGRVDGFWHCVS